MGNLNDLVRYYDSRRLWTLSRPHLGLPTATRGGANPGSLPAPSIREPNTHTKEKSILCVEYYNGKSNKLHALKCPCSRAEARDLVEELIWLNVHPLDIIIATPEDVPLDEISKFVFLNAVDHLLWTSRDQDELDAKMSQMS